MTASQVQKVATIGQVVLGGVILALQVVGLIKQRNIRTDVGPASS